MWTLMSVFLSFSLMLLMGKGIGLKMPLKKLPPLQLPVTLLPRVAAAALRMLKRVPASMIGFLARMALAVLVMSVLCSGVSGGFCARITRSEEARERRSQF